MQHGSPELEEGVQLITNQFIKVNASPSSFLRAVPGIDYLSTINRSVDPQTEGSSSLGSLGKHPLRKKTIITTGKMLEVNLKSTNTHPEEPATKSQNAAIRLADALKNYYRNDPTISTLDYLVERASIPADIQNGFINLVLITEKQEKDNEVNSLSHYSRTPFEDIPYGPGYFFDGVHQVKNNIKLKELFNPRVTATQNTSRGTDTQNPIERILIEGRPGSGKTTLTHFLANRWAEGDKKSVGEWVERFKVVLLIPLRQLNDCSPTAGNVIEFIYRCFNTVLNISKKEFIKALESYENQNEVFYLLDEFSEVAHLWYEKISGTYGKKLSGRAKLLRNLVNKQYWIVTSRPGYFHYQLRAYHRHLATIGLSKPDVNKYVRFFFRQFNQEEKGEEFVLAMDKNPLLRSIAQLPLHAELLCTIWKKHDKLFSTYLSQLTLTQLYQRLYAYLLERFLKEKCGEDTTSLECEKYEEHEALVDYLPFILALAWRLTQERIWIFQLTHYSSFIKEYYPKQRWQLLFNASSQESRKQARSKTWSEFEREKRKDFLEKSLNESGFFKKIGDGEQNIFQQRFYFIHPTIQEFLAACYVKRHFDEQISFICLHKYYPNYQLVWIFLAGILDRERIGNFFNIILFKDPLDLLKNVTFSLALRCWNETSDGKTLAKMDENYSSQFQEITTQIVKKFLASGLKGVFLGEAFIYFNLMLCGALHGQPWFTDILQDHLQKCTSIKEKYQFLEDAVEVFNFKSEEILPNFKLILKMTNEELKGIHVPSWSLYRSYCRLYFSLKKEEQKGFLFRIMDHWLYCQRHNLINSWDHTSFEQEVWAVIAGGHQSIITDFVELCVDLKRKNEIRLGIIKLIIEEEFWDHLNDDQQNRIVKSILALFTETGNIGNVSIEAALTLVAWKNYRTPDHLVSRWQNVWKKLSSQEQKILVHSLLPYCPHLSQKTISIDTTELLIHPEMWQYLPRENQRNIINGLLKAFEKLEKNENANKDSQVYKMHEVDRIIDLLELSVWEDEDKEYLIDFSLSSNESMGEQDNWESDLKGSYLNVLARCVCAMSDAQRFIRVVVKLIEWISDNQRLGFLRLKIIRLLIGNYHFKSCEHYSTWGIPNIWNVLDENQKSQIVVSAQSLWKNGHQNYRIRFGALKLINDRIFEDSSKEMPYAGIVRFADIWRKIDSGEAQWVSLWERMNDKDQNEILDSLFDFLNTRSELVKKNEKDILNAIQLLQGKEIRRKVKEERQEQFIRDFLLFSCDTQIKDDIRIESMKFLVKKFWNSLKPIEQKQVVDHLIKLSHCSWKAIKLLAEGAFDRFDLDQRKLVIENLLKLAGDPKTSEEVCWAAIRLLVDRKFDQDSLIMEYEFDKIPNPVNIWETLQVDERNQLITSLLNLARVVRGISIRVGTENVFSLLMHDKIWLQLTDIDLKELIYFFPKIYDEYWRFKDNGEKELWLQKIWLKVKVDKKLKVEFLYGLISKISNYKIKNVLRELKLTSEDWLDFFEKYSLENLDNIFKNQNVQWNFWNTSDERRAISRYIPWRTFFILRFIKCQDKETVDKWIKHKLMDENSLVYWQEDTLFWHEEGQFNQLAVSQVDYQEFLETFKTVPDMSFS